MQKKMKRKGMTLVEIILSIAIYALLALLLTEIMTVVNSTMKSTSQLNTRLNYEAKYADNLQTVDANGVTFALNAEDVTRDDGTTGKAPAVKVSIEFGGNTLSVDKDGNQLRASEYTTHYNGAISGVDYHADTNYKFMTFNKVGFPPSAKESDSFWVHLVLPDNADEITHIEYYNYLDPEESPSGDHPLVTAHTTLNGPFTAGQVLDIETYNNADPAGLAASTQGTITFEIYGDTVAPSSGNTLHDVMLSDATPTFYTSLKVSEYTNYYTDCSITYNGDGTWGFPVSTGGEEEEGD